MHVTANSKHVQFNSSTLTTHGIACAGTSGKPTTPTFAGVYLGMGSTLAGGIEICCSSVQYIEITMPNKVSREKTGFLQQLGCLFHLVCWWNWSGKDGIDCSIPLILQDSAGVK